MGRREAGAAEREREREYHERERERERDGLRERERESLREERDQLRERESRRNSVVMGRARGGGGRRRGRASQRVILSRAAFKKELMYLHSPWRAAARRPTPTCPAQRAPLTMTTYRS